MSIFPLDFLSYKSTAIPSNGLSVLHTCDN
ncbi:Uncharacterised protein [Serratia marcescens]|nr:Uncharacterised protein [Serratia marcescens]CUY86808.1 Uncharacterised protein [Serratia marcescens]CUY96914.1 Uncharacterised protein [Serratia marcescens]CUZ02451.1 Uncharacterised protein [Serratia marcescens]CUZ03597.1 Uncharacterised protein [Serratia marcescens]